MCIPVYTLCDTLIQDVEQRGCEIQMELLNLSIHLEIILPMWETSGTSSIPHRHLWTSNLAISSQTLHNILRDRNKVGLQANCPQKIVRALQIVKQRAQWPLSILADFNLCCMKYIRKAIWALTKYWWPSNFSCLEPKWPLKLLAYFVPCIFSHIF